MLYEVMVNNTINKMASKVPAASATKLPPAHVQLDVLPYVAPILSLTVTYAGGDKGSRYCRRDSGGEVGYRMEVWF